MGNPKRGYICYVNRDARHPDGTPKANRPAVVVSNDELNRTNAAVMVVYLTMNKSHTKPFDIMTMALNRTNYTLCDRIFAVDKTKLGEPIGRLSDGELKALDSALTEALGIDRISTQASITAPKLESTPACAPTTKSDELARVEAERDVYKKLCDQLIEAFKAERK